MNASLEAFSSQLRATGTLNPAYKPSDTVPIRWATAHGTMEPDYIKLEMSSDGGATWTVIEAKLENDGEYDWNISTLTPAVYNIRLTAVIRSSEDVIEVGSFLLDNQVPVVGADQTIVVTEDTPQNFTLNTPTENDQYKLVFMTNPSRGTLTGCVANSSVLNCSYTPNLNNEADDSFTYKVVDRAGNESAVATVTLDVTPVNDLPVIQTLACPTTIGENYNYSCTIAATDVDLPSPLTLTYHLDGTTTCGAWLTIDANTGEVSGTPAAAEVGTNCQVDVYAEDDVAGQSTRFSWNISVTNSAPIINVTGGPYSLLEDAAFAVIIPGANVSSIEESGSTYSLVTPTASGDHCVDHAASPASSNLTIDASTGEVSFRPAADYQGVCYIRIALTDSFPSTGYTELALTVTNVQDAPVVATNLTPCSASATEDVAYSCTVAITDPDPENLTVIRDGGDDCVWLTETPSADGRTVTISGTPDDTNVGGCQLEIRATDPNAASHMQSLAITVANAPPTLTIGTPDVLTEDDASFASSVVEVLSDADVSSLDEGQGVYSLVYTGLSGTACNDTSVVATPASDILINATTGAVSIKPRAHYFGSCFAKIRFDDQNGAGNSVVDQEIEIIVNPVNDAPTITSVPTTWEILLDPGVNKVENVPLTLSVGPANESAQTASLICTNSNPTRLNVNCSATRVGDGSVNIVLTATPGVDSSAVVTVKVKDDAGGTDESTVATINVSLTDAVVLAPIAADAVNYDIWSKAKNEYSTTVANSNRTFVVRVNPGVKVYSTDPTKAAMMTGTVDGALATTARVRLINQGSIIGASGAGGASSSIADPGGVREGQDGGTALQIYANHANVTIINEGFIFGGGGGGGRGGTENSDGANGSGGAGEGPMSTAVAGGAGNSGGVGGAAATSLSAGATTPGYIPSNGHAQTNGSGGQGGSSCLIGAALGNNPGEAKFGRGGFGAGFGGGAGSCSLAYGGGGGGGYFGGGGGSGGLSNVVGDSNVNNDVNGYRGGNGGAAIQVPNSVVNPSDINIVIQSEPGSQIAGCVWNDISQKYLTGVTNDSDFNARVLTFSPTAAQSVNAPSSIRVWNNGRGKAYR
ncbi:Ig-like domain-containing protein [Bdellovibrio bacteriovorus]|uniref:Ig-like domain-containing protein n=1 Tax=Bdellovibrio bacteriovorus TaxID=959 RepID=UPI0035A5AA1B